MRVWLSLSVCRHLVCGDRKLIHTPYGRTCLSIQCFQVMSQASGASPVAPILKMSRLSSETFSNLSRTLQHRRGQAYSQADGAQAWVLILTGYLLRMGVFLCFMKVSLDLCGFAVNPLYLPGIRYQEVLLSHRHLHLCLPHPTKVQRFQRLGWAGVRSPTTLCSTMVWHFIFITNGALFLSPTAPLPPWAHWPFFRGKVRHTFGWKLHQ